MSFPSWWAPLVRASVLAGTALLAGLLIGHPALTVALVLAAMLARQQYMLERVRQWLRRDRVDLAPDAGGAWGDVIGLIRRLFRRKQYHKRRMLQLLRELRSSTAAIADGVVMLNPAAEILWFNRAAARLLHLRGRTDIGLRVDNLVRRPEFVEYLRSGKYTIPVIVQAGGLSDQYLHFQIVPYGAGQLLLMVRDVTQQARLEEMRKDFVANASHELRSPLTVISGYLETLAQDESVDPNLRGPIDAMRRQALRMTAIVHDLLELSRLEAEEGAPTGEPVDVGGLVGRLRSDLLARLNQTRDWQILVDSSDRLLGIEATR